MNSPTRILETLRDRDLFELASQVAANHRLPLEAICSDSHLPELVAARYELWERLRGVLPSAAAVGRIFGTDHSSITRALSEQHGVVEVVLSMFDGAQGESYTLRWRKKPDPFGVTDRHEGQTTWFARYLEARAYFDKVCRIAGAPSFASRAAAGEVTP